MSCISIPVRRVVREGAQSGLSVLPDGWTQRRYDAWKRENTTGIGIREYGFAVRDGVIEGVKSPAFQIGVGTLILIPSGGASAPGIFAAIGTSSGALSIMTGIGRTVSSLSGHDDARWRNVPTSPIQFRGALAGQLISGDPAAGIRATALAEGVVGLSFSFNGDPKGRSKRGRSKRAIQKGQQRSFMQGKIRGF